MGIKIDRKSTTHYILTEGTVDKLIAHSQWHKDGVARQKMPGGPRQSIKRKEMPEVFSTLTKVSLTYGSLIK